MKTFIVSLTIISMFMVIGFTEAAITSVPKDYPTIQKGIDAASSGDTVLVADGVYKGEGNVNLDFKGKAITLKSENGAANCIIDCENKDNTRGFYFHSRETLSSVVDGFTIRNATASGIFCYEGPSPTIINNVITNNSSNGSGGGINCNNGCSPKINNNVITGNSSNAYGGGIYCWWSSPMITKNIIIETQLIPVVAEFIVRITRSQQ